MNSESKGLDDPTAEDQVESAWLSLIGEALAPHDLNAGEAAGVRSRLLRRAAASVRRHAGLITIRSGDGAWRTLKAGVRVKLLCEGAQGASVLIELSPGASLPAHRHQHLEEGIVLRGELQHGDLHLGPGDYHVSPPGSRHGRISSAAGGLAYLRGSALGHTSQALGELLGGLLPGDGPPSHSVLASDDGWEAIADGVEQKILWRDGDRISRFLRLAAGARLPPHAHDGEEECVILRGDAFVGDLLLQAGDFHLAPSGSEHGEVSSDCGALVFVRGREVLPLRP
ncbi:MAG: cupin domain-containing protein [Candidatus Accumulibacter sp. UW26]|jgi:anti-sigma factor ChrR (cupin superfamily)